MMTQTCYSTFGIRICKIDTLHIMPKTINYNYYTRKYIGQVGKFRSAKDKSATREYLNQAC